MKFFLTVLALVFFAVPASAATTKTVWNQSIDSPANVAAGASVTAALSTICSGTGECRDEKGHREREQRGEDEEEEI